MLKVKENTKKNFWNNVKARRIVVAVRQRVRSVIILSLIQNLEI
jgi:hypothetical protein